MANIIEITDFSAPELDIYARLTENQLLCRADPSQALFIAESPLVIGRALDAGCVPVSALIATKHIEGQASDISRAGCSAPCAARSCRPSRRSAPPRGALPCSKT